MQVTRTRYVSPIFRRRQKQGREVIQAETHWLDTWLPRISHFSQFGLFVITIGSLYFTVLPLYQKAVLDEAIARKEVELAASEKSLEQSYVRLRTFAVKEFIFGTAVQCSSLKLPPQRLRDLDKKSSPSQSAAEEIFGIHAGACLKDEFQKSTSLKELRASDLQSLASYIERIAADLALKRDAALKEYQSIPQRAKTDPSILKPVGPFSEHMLAILSKSQPVAWIEASRFSLAVTETQSAVAHDYDAYVRNQIATLRSIKWDASR